MTQSEFEALRGELRAFRADIESRLASLQADIMRLEAKIDEKPGALVIYQATFGMFTGISAVIVGTIIVMKTLGFLP